MEINSSMWRTRPDYQINITAFDGRILLQSGEEKIASSTQVLLVQEQDHEPVYYFPRRDVTMASLQKTSKVTYCPFKGNAIHWALTLEDTLIDVAAWSYEKPFEQLAAIQNYIAFYPEIMEHAKFTQYAVTVPD